jgi:hypothetical protein
MGKHGAQVEERTRTTQVATVLVIWVAGLGVGFVGFLSAAAKYGCAADADGLGCKTSGSVLGIVLVVIVALVVATVTLLAFDRAPRRVLAAGVIGLIGLAACFIAAEILLSST